MTVTADRASGFTDPARSDDCWLPAGHWDPEFKDALNARLDALSQLQAGWDGHSGKPIDPAIIAAARVFLAALPENIAFRPQVTPMSAGNLQFEWHAGPKTLELEFEDGQTIHFLQWQPADGLEEEDTFPAAKIEKAVELIRWFMSGMC